MLRRAGFLFLLYVQNTFFWHRMQRDYGSVLMVRRSVWSHRFEWVTQLFNRAWPDLLWISDWQFWTFLLASV